MNRTRSVRAAFILSIAVACSLSLWAQQAGNSGDPAMPSRLSALLARANANAGAKSSSVVQRAPNGATVSGGSSSWTPGKTSFGAPSQPLGIWRDGAALSAPPPTASATTLTVPLPSGLSSRSSTLPSELSVSRPAGFTPPASLKQPAGFKPLSSGNSMAGRNTSSSVRHGSAPGSLSSRSVGLGRSGRMQSRSALAGRSGLAKAPGPRGGAPDFHARSLPGKAGAAGAKKSAQGGTGRTNQRGHAVGSGLSTLRGMEPASPVAHEIGTLPRSTSPDTQP